MKYIRKNFQIYLSHDLDTCICMHGVTWHFNSKKLKKIRKHETLLDLMSCHQDDVVKKLACLTKVWTHPLTKRRNSLEGSWFREGTVHVWWRTGDSFLLWPSNFFLRLTCTNTIVMWKFGKFQGSFDLLKTFMWFSSHLMTVIQILTTCTCNG